VQPAQRSKLADLWATAYDVETNRDNKVAKKATPSVEELIEAGEARMLARLPAQVTDGQLNRFTELYCQIEGLAVLRLPMYASRTGLSEGQRSKIEGFVSHYRDRSREHHQFIFSSKSRQEAAPAVQKLAALSTELDSKILDVLNVKQRSEWTKLAGKRYDWRPVLKVLAYYPVGDS
jgi:hypothetical protein